MGANIKKRTLTIFISNVLVTLGCGGKIAENCTYFQSASSSQPAGQCGVTICKCSSDICQVGDLTDLGALHYTFELFALLNYRL